MGTDTERAATFAQRLRRHRQDAGLSQEDLAERAGLSARGISDLERGVRQTPQRHTIRRLAEALGLGPEAAARLAVVRRARGPAEAGAGGPPGAAGGGAGAAGARLPAPLTSFVGRQREVAAAAALLRRPEVRVLTLAGPGGVGKTRLALAVAAAVAGQFPGGVWLVALAALADPALVPQAVAQAVGVREEPGRPLLATLADALRPRRVLLVLDNCEHLLAAVPLVAELLAAGPGVQLLATSRAPLRLSGEREYPVAPLAVADGAVGGEAGDAVRLFLDRARGVQPGFALTPQNATAVAAICRRLDGLPLAIELAAARVRHLPPAALLARLESPPGGRRLLTGGVRDAPARQRTLRDTIAWSYDLLPPGAQTLFRRLGVFAGGFSLEAAEAVGAAGPAPDTLADLSSLVDMSLVEAVVPGPAGAAGTGEARYRLLETIREDARERLAAAGEAAPAASRHAAYYTRLAARAAPARGDAAQATAPWLDRLEADHDNVRAALSWLEATGDTAAVLRLVTAVAPFWQIRGHFAEASRWLEAGLAAPAAAPDALRATALHRAGTLADVRGDAAEARARLEASLGLFRRLGAEPEAAGVLLSLGWQARGEGDFGRARALFEEGLARFRAAGDAPGTALALNNLGWLAERQGELTRAETLLAESLAVARRAGAPGVVGPALQNLGKVALRRGDTTRAAALFGASLRAKLELGHREQVASLLVWIARLAERTGQPERAVRLLGAQQALRASLHAPRLPALPPEHDPVAAAVRTRLGAARFGAGWAAGRALAGEQAIALARATADAIAAAPVAPPRPGTSGRMRLAGGLTAREAEVLALVAAGRSNQEIAAILDLSVRTVERHLARVYDRLGLAGKAARAAAAAYAVGHGLATPAAVAD